MSGLRAPFPWFGGKSRVSHLVWERFGDVRNYVEPFAGSLAVLLGRTSEPKIETVNDLDCWIANFWRALSANPEELAGWADWPVNEADLHARHLWLVNQVEFRERMKTEPEFYDAKIAGWWVWGISQWIGAGWCAAAGGDRRQDPPGDPWRKRPSLGEGGRGVVAPQVVTRKRPYLTNHGGGMGVHGGRNRVPQQLPDLSGDAGAAGRGVFASAFQRDCGSAGIYAWMSALAARLRRVRVCCGDWSRILGPAPTTCIGTTGVFLDPPYAVEERSEVYGEESRDVAHAVREWALANGDNPELRIALCGYEGEHAMPDTWSVVAWKANGGYSNQNREGSRGKVNAQRERIWFSPHCLDAYSLFAAEGA